MITQTYEELAAKLGIPNLRNNIATRAWDKLSAVFKTEANNVQPATVYFSKIEPPVTESADFELSSDINNLTVAIGFRANHETGALDMTTYRVVRSLPVFENFIYREVNVETGVTIDEEAIGCVKSSDKLWWLPDAKDTVGQARLLNTVCACMKATKEAENLRLVKQALQIA